MDEYESDDSLSDVGSGVSTNVLLGYASKEPTEDTFSQLGGVPTWLHPAQHAPPQMVKCKSCSDYMALLVQLNGDLPAKFPGHERRLYIWGCRKKTCRRKDGSVRAVRGVRLSKQALGKTHDATPKQNADSINIADEAPSPMQNVGGALFGTANPSASSAANPFSSATASNPFSAAPTSATANPFSSAPAPPSTLAAKPPQRPSATNTTSTTTDTLPETFTQKVRISSPAQPSPPTQPPTPWPPSSAFPIPYPTYHLDADYEYLSPSTSASASASTANGKYTAFMDRADPTAEADAASTSRKATAGANDDDETPHDKAFLHFADTLAQNPEQVLRYEFAGLPLLYTRRDAVGRAFSAAAAAGSGSGMPRCSRCGVGRVFELQVTPHAIVELEAGDDGDAAEGMEWGTVILGVCGADCGGGSVAEARGGAEWAEDERVRYVEEWVGVQWEEVVDTRGGARRRG